MRHMKRGGRSIAALCPVVLLCVVQLGKGVFLNPCIRDQASLEPCQCGDNACQIGDICSAMTSACVEESCAELLKHALNKTVYIPYESNHALTRRCELPNEVQIFIGTIVIKSGVGAASDAGVYRSSSAESKFRLFSVMSGGKLVLDAATISGGEVSATEPTDCSNSGSDCGSGGLVRVLGGEFVAKSDATLSHGSAANLGGAVYIGSNGLMNIDMPVKFIENIVTGTGNDDQLLDDELVWLNNTIHEGSGGEDIFRGAKTLQEMFPGHLHIATDAQIKIIKPR